MEQIYLKSVELNLPIILNDTREELEKCVRECNPQLILEIGSAIGYSAAVMLSAAPNAKLITLEKDAERAALCKLNLARVAGKRATSLNCDAMEFLNNYNGQKFDFVFIDGPKGQYLNYIKKLEKMLNKNAVIFCDNVYFHGMVNGKTPITKGVKTMIKNLREFNEYMLNSPNFKTQIIDKGDGILIAKYVK